MKLAPILTVAAALAVGTAIGWHRPAPTGADREPRTPLPTKTLRTASGPRADEAGRTGVNEEARAEVDRILSIDPPTDRLRELIHFANRIPTAKLQAWADRGRLNSGDRLQDEVFERIVVERLMEADPGVALMRVADNVNDLYAKFRAWMQDDPDAALRFILGANPTLLDQLSRVAFKEWVRSDPQRALTLLDGVARRHRVELAWSLVRDLPPLAETHSDELVALAQGWPSQWRHCIQVATAKPGWMKNPVGTVKWMMGQGMSAEVFAQVLDDLANSDDGKRMPSALDYLDAIPEAWLETAARRADHAVVRRDPLGWLAADAETLGIAPALLDKLQCEAAAQLQGRGDPVALMAGATPTVQAALAVAAVNRGFYSDQEATDRWIESLDHPDVRAAARQRFSVLAAPDKAYPWLYNGPGPRFLDGPAPAPPELAPDEKKRKMHELIARSDGDGISLPQVGEAFHYVLESGPEAASGDLSTRLIDHAVRWTRENAPAAAGWAVALPAGPNRQWALRNVARQWAGQAPSEARKWADSLPDPADRVTVLEELR